MKKLMGILLIVVMLIGLLPASIGFADESLASQLLASTTKGEVVAILNSADNMTALGLSDYTKLFCEAFTDAEREKVAEVFLAGTPSAEADIAAAFCAGITAVVEAVKVDPNLVMYEDFSGKGARINGLAPTIGEGSWVATANGSSSFIATTAGKSIAGTDNTSFISLGGTKSNTATYSVTEGRYVITAYLHDACTENVRSNLAFNFMSGSSTAFILGIGINKNAGTTWMGSVKAGTYVEFTDADGVGIPRYKGWNKFVVTVSKDGISCVINGKEVSECASLNTPASITGFQMSATGVWGATATNAIYIDAISVVQKKSLAENLLDCTTKGEVVAILNSTDNMTALGLSDYTKLFCEAFTDAEREKVAEVFLAGTPAAEADIAAAFCAGITAVVEAVKVDPNLVMYEDFEGKSGKLYDKAPTIGTGTWSGASQSGGSSTAVTTGKALVGNTSFITMGGKKTDYTTYTLDEGQYVITAYLYDMMTEGETRSNLTFDLNGISPGFMVGLDLSGNYNTAWMGRVNGSADQVLTDTDGNPIARYKGWNKLVIEVSSKGLACIINGKSVSQCAAVEGHLSITGFTINQRQVWGSATAYNTVYADAISVVQKQSLAKNLLDCTTKEEVVALLSSTENMAEFGLSDYAVLYTGAFTPAEKEKVAEVFLAEAPKTEADIESAFRAGIAETVTPTAEHGEIIMYEDFEGKSGKLYDKAPTIGTGTWTGASQSGGSSTAVTTGKALVGNTSFITMGGKKTDYTTYTLDEGQYVITAYLYDMMTEGETRSNLTFDLNGISPGFMVGLDLSGKHNDAWMGRVNGSADQVLTDLNGNPIARVRGWNKLVINVSKSGIDCFINGKEVKECSVLNYPLSITGFTINQRQAWGSSTYYGTNYTDAISVDAIRPCNFSLVGSAVKIKPNSDYAKGYVAIVAFYDNDGDLVDVAFNDNPGSELSVTAQNVPQGVTVKTAKGIAWNNLAEMKPIASMKAFNLGGN